ncbi:MAG: permease, partial [Clostridia bacterium]|nr:permease [Clostridia bacterium]
MTLGLLSIKSITYLTFTVLLILALGYLLGRVSIKGVSLGSAGVFIVALLYGAFFYSTLEPNLVVSEITYVKEALKIIENIGLVFFVTSVGFIAGPSFFRNLKKNFKSYISLGLIIILSSCLVTVAIILIGGGGTPEEHESFKALVVGLLSGALTSTPAFSAAKEAVGPALEDPVAVGHGIAYLFGVIGVVLFVQLVPKFAKADMVVERQKIMVASEEKEDDGRELIQLDEFGIAAFSVAAMIGIIVGSISAGGFSLTVTGGCLLASLVFGH